MVAFKKLAVSLPSETFKALERARAKLKRTRSDAVTTAIDHWLKSIATAEMDRQYIEGYRRIPFVESPDHDAWTKLTLQGLGGWDPPEPSRASDAIEARPKRRRK
jgi:hypothetical protein